MRTFVIAEIGVNHNGDRKLALELIDVAARAGADAAKFQSFKADSIAVENAEMVAYQRRAVGGNNQHEMLRKLQLSDDDHAVIAEHCRISGIEFMSTAFDVRSLSLLCSLGIRRIKIPSGEITNDPYLIDCARRRLPIILSTGMSTMEEVLHAVEVIKNCWSACGYPSGEAPLTILHCTSAYPADFADVNLRAMVAMSEQTGCFMGYSDHTQGTFVAPLAVALGARVIEKHITLDRTMQGPDHAASIEPDELAALIATIRQVETLLGDGVKQPRTAELEARGLVRRGLKAARDMSAGTVVTAADIAILRPATGLAPTAFDRIVGRTLTTALKAGDALVETHFAP